VFDYYFGEVSEWLKVHAWKACVGASLPWREILRTNVVRTNNGHKSEDLWLPYSNRIIPTIYQVSKLLGHASVTTTEKHYAPLLATDVEEFVL